ncbi:thiosulfate ABC transporter substrate-binding protein CysP [Tropicimonas sp.]|uniref:thiosulfate ABC transporter substrate-binding protein CysP n=1 Tax=Tropicimonas sp. TaxID=2067044 RepID=UPI003A8BE218
MLRFLPRPFRHSAIVAATLAMAAATLPARAEQVEILNVSYDIARELYARINPAFIAQWNAETGDDLTVNQSHAGSSKQARAILQGLQADLVTFNQVTDVQVLADAGFVSANWRDEFPNNASPYYSLPAFMVRGGNPKGIEDWDDLIRDDVQIVFPNPKTSGNGRYTYLAAYAYALAGNNGDDEAAQAFVDKLLANVAVFDTGGRGATTTFVERGIGDVLITFEAEVENIRKAEADGAYDRVVPSLSLLAEFPVAVVDRIADARGTANVAQGYLEFLYGSEGQEILASFNNRVHDPEVVAAHAADFPEVTLVKVEDVFGGWDKAMETHFASGGVLDRLLAN